MKPTLHLVKLKGVSIEEQLRLEEALLRLDRRNFCIIQDGTDPAIVMGISGKSEEHVNKALSASYQLPIIKRYSGGGTVVVDRNTAFISFICGVQELQVLPCPDKIFCWSQSIYQHMFHPHPFELQERDYTFNKRKFGGNAQYLCRDRWVHHTTMLWDYDEELMSCLHLPKRRPEYRQTRSHSEFLCKLKDHMTDRNEFWDRLRQTLEHFFVVQELGQSEVLSYLERQYRIGTRRVE